MIQLRRRNHLQPDTINVIKTPAMPMDTAVVPTACAQTTGSITVYANAGTLLIPLRSADRAPLRRRLPTITLYLDQPLRWCLCRRLTESAGCTGTLNVNVPNIPESNGHYQQYRRIMPPGVKWCNPYHYAWSWCNCRGPHIRLPGRVDHIPKQCCFCSHLYRTGRRYLFSFVNSSGCSGNRCKHRCFSPVWRRHHNG